MTTYGTLTRVDEDKYRLYKNQNGETGRMAFKYPEIIHNHFQYQDAFEQHKAKIMEPIALE